MSGAAYDLLCRLPGGYVDSAGTVHQEAELSPLSGREEELLVASSEVSPAALVTRILSHCVRRIGDIHPVTDAVTRQLLVADRQYLLLQLHMHTFGNRVDGTLSCPWPHCGSRMDIDFLITDVPVKRCDTVARTYEITLSEEAVERETSAAKRNLRFRLPNGADQEVVGPYLAENEAGALNALLARCLVGADSTTEVKNLTLRAKKEVESAMREAAPYVELHMDVTCPECGRSYTAPFDVQDFFLGELRTSHDLLYRQVHYLAYHYHWSEQEIIGMTRDKRLAYIGILADEIEALNCAL